MTNPHHQNPSGHNPNRGDLARTEQWLLNHEEWPVPNDDLRAKVIRNASTAQVQAKEKNRSQTVLMMCIVFCGAITWFMQDIAGGMEDPQSSAMLAVADDGWMRPVDHQVTYVTSSIPRTTYDWALVQAHITWRRLVNQRLNRVMWQ